MPTFRTVLSEEKVKVAVVFEPDMRIRPRRLTVRNTADGAEFRIEV
jgi:hypothetical protein